MEWKINGRILFSFLLVLPWSLAAQTVETVAGPIPRVNNGLAVLPNGDVLASDLFGTGFNGNSVHRISPNGTYTLFADGLSQPAGIVLGPDESVFIAEFSSGQISKIDTLGNLTLFASGLSQPSGLVFDADSNLYVTNYGNGTISKIGQDGTVSSFASGLSQPVGLTMDENGVLFAANLSDGIVFQIDSLGNKSIHATLFDVPLGFMTYSQGTLFVTATEGNRIYAIDSNGNSVIFAGTGVAGTTDGPASSAQFTNPDGIASNATGDTIYVSENNTNLLRRIVLPSPTGVAVPEPQAIPQFSFSPNPIVDQINIQYLVSMPGKVTLDIYQADGRLHTPVFSAVHTEGEYQVSLDAYGWSPGIYFANINFNSMSIKTYKLVVYE